MWFVRREFLQLAGGVIAVFSHSARAQTQAGAPSPIEVLRSDLLGQDHKVMETLVTVVTFPPGSVSRWHVHPGAQELVFGLEGKLTLEIEGQGAKRVGVGEIPHLAGQHVDLRRSQHLQELGPSFHYEVWSFTVICLEKFLQLVEGRSHGGGVCGGRMGSCGF